MKTNWNTREAVIVYLLFFITLPIGLGAQGSIGSDSSMGAIPAVDPWGLGLKFEELGEVELQGQRCWRLQLEGPYGDDPDSLRIEMLVRQTDNRPLQVDYYDQQGESVRTLYLEDVQRIAGAPAAMTLTLKDHVSGYETSINLLINYELKSLDQ